MIRKLGLAILAVAALGATACDNTGTRIRDLCGDPPSSTDKTSEQTVKASVNQLANKIGAATFEAQLKESATQVFRNANDMGHANVVYQYQTCAMVAGSDKLDVNERLAVLTSARDAIASSIAAAEGLKQECLAKRVGELTGEVLTLRQKASARAAGPGIGGGTKKAHANLCLSVPKDYVVTKGPTINRLACNQGRCDDKRRDPEAKSDGSTVYCTVLEARSESASFGAGGWYEAEMVIEAAKNITEAAKDSARLECGLPKQGSGAAGG